jgi:hypothetical protein
MKRMCLFARCGIIGLTLDDVPGVWARKHERPHMPILCLRSFVVPRVRMVQVAIPLPFLVAPDFPEPHDAHRLSCSTRRFLWNSGKRFTFGPEHERGSRFIAVQWDSRGTESYE